MRQAVKLKKMTPEAFVQQKAEVLGALKKLGEALTPREEQFLGEHMSKSLAAFEQVDNRIGSGAEKTLLDLAGSQVKSAQN